MREYSDKFHQISCWHDEHPDDYEKILSDFISFLKVNMNYLSIKYLFVI